VAGERSGRAGERRENVSVVFSQYSRNPPKYGLGMKFATDSKFCVLGLITVYACVCVRRMGLHRCTWLPRKTTRSSSSFCWQTTLVRHWPPRSVCCALCLLQFVFRRATLAAAETASLFLAASANC